jgi:hypothetical protein
VSFGFTLLGALVVLLPGFFGYYGFRLGEATDLVSPRPDRPNSTFTLTLIVFFALTGHIIGSGAFALNEWIARQWPIFETRFDPNPYRWLLTGKAPATLPAWAISYSLIYVVVLAVAIGWIAEQMARSQPITSRTHPTRFGWLVDIVAEVEKGTSIAIGYVRTTSNHDGAWIAYEGTVRRLHLDDNDKVTMIVLETCDRFLVRIDGDEIDRRDREKEPIALLHLNDSEIADYAFEVLKIPTPEEFEERVDDPALAL